MKVHFGGSLPAFKENPESYKKIRQAIIKNQGIILRDWIKEESLGKELGLSDMYERTLKAIKSADAVILECTSDISSIGQQMSIAFEENIPVLLLTPKDTNSNIGSFISREQMKHLVRKTYSVDTIDQIIKDFFKWAEENDQFARFNLVLEKKLDQFLKEKAKQNNTSKTEEIRKLIIQDIQTQGR